MNEPDQNQLKELAPENRVIGSLSERSNASSEMNSTYREFFKRMSQSDYGISNETHTTLGFVDICPDMSLCDMRIQLRFCTSDYRVLTFKVMWHSYAKTVHVLNYPACSTIHHLPAIGQNGNIYPYEYDGNWGVIKCFHTTEETFERVFVEVLTEYFLQSVAAEYGCGPAPGQNRGFDIVVYQGCIQIEMEMCLNTHDWKPSDQETIKEKLHKLHQIGMVHRDIKPQNIGYSLSLQEPVFLDFGVSQLLEQAPGEETMTLFAGSPGYASIQHCSLYGSASPGFVDLFYNDVFCLEKTLSEIKNGRKTINLKNLEKQNQGQKCANQLNKQNSNELKKQTYDSDKRQQLVNSHIMSSFMIFCLFVNNRVILQTDKLDRLMGGNVEQLLMLTTSFPYSKIRQEFVARMMKRNKSAFANDKSVFSIEQKRFEQIKPQESSNSRNQVFFFEEQYRSRYEWINKEVEVINRLIGELKIVEYSLDDLLLNSRKVEMMSRIEYCRKMAEYLSVQTCCSRLEDKIKACQILFRRENVNVNTSGLEEIQVLAKENRIILSHLLESAETLDAQAITTTFSNLFLLEQFTPNQSLTLLHKITKFEWPVLVKFRALFKLFRLAQWPSAQTKATAYSDESLSKYSDLIQSSMRKSISSKNNMAIATFMYELLLVSLNCDEERVQTLNKFWERTFEGSELSDMMIEVSLQLKWVNLRILSFQQRFKTYQDKLIEAKQLQKCLYFNTEHIELYHFFQAITSRNLGYSHTVETVYERFRRCFHFQSLIEKYPIYLDYQMLHYTSGKLRKEQCLVRTLKNVNLSQIISNPDINTFVSAVVNPNRGLVVGQRSETRTRKIIERSIHMHELSQLNLLTILEQVGWDIASFGCYTVSNLMNFLYYYEHNDTTRNFVAELRAKLIRAGRKYPEQQNFSYTPRQAVINLMQLEVFQSYQNTTKMIEYMMQIITKYETSAVEARLLLPRLLTLAIRQPLKDQKYGIIKFCWEKIRVFNCHDIMFKQNCLFFIMKELTIHQAREDEAYTVQVYLLNHFYHFPQRQKFEVYKNHITTFYSNYQSAKLSMLRYTVQVIKQKRTTSRMHNNPYSSLFHSFLLESTVNDCSMTPAFLSSICNNLASMVVFVRAYVAHNIYRFQLQAFTWLRHLLVNGLQSDPFVQYLVQLINMKQVTPERLMRLIRFKIKQSRRYSDRELELKDFGSTISSVGKKVWEQVGVHEKTTAKGSMKSYEKMGRKIHAILCNSSGVSYS